MDSRGRPHIPREQWLREMAAKRFNPIGMKFGRWTVLGFSHAVAKGARYFLCKCECGTERAVLERSFRLTSKSQSCGCLRPAHNKIHGMTGSPEYRSWNGAISRCHNPKNRRYRFYGGRGITVCDRWRTFKNFLDDMGVKPSPWLQIERINNNDGYHPGNCKWATPTEQQRNTSRTVWVTIHNERMALSECVKKYGLNRSSVASRIKKCGAASWEEAISYFLGPVHG